MKIFEKINEVYKENKPFVVYRKPNVNIVSGFFIDDDTLYYTSNFSEPGFVFAPFNSNEKAILFPLEKADFFSEKLSYSVLMDSEKEIPKNEASKESHIKLVEKTVHEISSSDIKKIVVSRKEEVKNTNFNLIEVYKKLLQNYKNAFVYVWFHPKVGLWLGATPETLLDVNNSSFKTMSLAGTQVYKKTKNVVWKSKELDEQQLVTDFIKNQLQDVSSNLKIDKTETVKAGSLLHLKTKITGNLIQESTLKTLIRALHPTPAVCGLPRNKAKEFILQNENYNRDFYTGFLGEINLKSSQAESKKSSLFVNLRCMEIKENFASIFVGGGITKDSNAEKEWEETVSKSKIMKRIL